MLGRLNANAHGHFTARGQYSAATVRGTIWSVANQCDGTLTHVKRGVVQVRDFRRRKTITLFTGQSYLAKAPHPSSAMRISTSVHGCTRAGRSAAIVSALLVALAAGAGLAASAQAATYTVGTLNDVTGRARIPPLAPARCGSSINYENALAATPNPPDTHRRPGRHVRPGQRRTRNHAVARDRRRGGAHHARGACRQACPRHACSTSRSRTAAARRRWPSRGSRSQAGPPTNATASSAATSSTPGRWSSTKTGSPKAPHPRAAGSPTTGARCSSSARSCRTTTAAPAAGTRAGSRTTAPLSAAPPASPARRRS